MPSPERPGTPTPGPPLPRWRVGAEDTFHRRRRVLIEEAHQVGGATGPVVWVRIAEAVPERASLIALAPTLAEAVRVLEGAVREMAEHIEECLRCQGRGLEPGDRESACSRCGGQGKTLDATGSLSAVEDALAHRAVMAALAALKGVV